MTLPTVNDRTFDAQVLESDRPVLVEFGAAWCQPCRRQKPVLEALAEERADVRFVEVDVDASPETAKRYGVRGVPAIFLFRDGEVAGQAHGLQPPHRLRALIDG